MDELTGSNNEFALPNSDVVSSISSLESTAVILRIELVLEKIVNAIAENKGELSIELKQRTSINNTVDRSSSSYYQTRFPGRNRAEAWRFSACSMIRS